jgi:LytS/YehU family sensor histidine kinase
MLSLIIAWLFNFALFILTTHIYRKIIRKKNIEAMKLHKFLLYPITANIIISLIVQVFKSEILNFEQIFWEDYKESFGNYFLQSLDIFRFAMPWFIFYHGIRFAELAIQNERDKLEAQMQLKIAELENLKSQLNPHFLFNALNSIRSLTLTDPNLARDAITKLSDLLRISLTYKDLQDIPFEEELNLVKDYLSLEKIRFEDRLKYSFEISKGILKVLVPPMSLQLLAENAVKHGISKEKLGGEVVVYAYKKEGNLVFGIRNTGSLVKLISDKNKRQGIGLENLRRRLELNYGINDGFQISESNRVVTSQVNIPMKVK